MSNQEKSAVDHHIMMGEALLRLEKNSDFKKLILQGYLEDKVLASVSLLGVPQIRDKGERSAVLEDLVSASNLQYFFQQVRAFHEGAKNPVLSDEEQAELDALGEADETKVN